MGDVVHVNMQHIRKPLSELTAANEIYLSGQFVTAIDDATGNEGVKQGDWDKDNDPDQLHATRFNDRPWLIAPAEFGASKVNVFSADTDNGAGNAHYGYAGGVATITDLRFLGKANFPIFCTQTGGGCLRKDIVTYDPIGGRVLINGLELQPGEQFFFALSTGITIDPDYLTLNAKIDAVQNKIDTMLFPLLPTGLAPGVIPSHAKLWWVGDLAALAGTGWQECIAMRGLYPMAIKATDADYNKAFGDTIGGKTFKISNVGMLPKHNHLTVVNDFVSHNGHPSEFMRALSPLRALIKYFFKTDGGGAESYELCGAAAEGTEPDISPSSNTGKDDPDPIKFISPSMMGYWIEYVGL